MKGKRKGFTLVELLVVIAIIALLMGILMPALSRVRQIAFRMVCGSNLSGIGRAMLIYANDYDNDFPRAGYVGTVWVDELLQWAATDRTGAFGNPVGGGVTSATITSSFYLLVRYAEVTPKSFVCKSESNTTVFKVENYLSSGYEDEDVWDFGPGPSTNESYSPTNHCSYSYHMPYNRFFLSTASSEPGMAVAADQNPWLDNDTDASQFLWDSHEKFDGITKYQFGNAGAHQREGQNVLFMDNHVSFEKQSFCGIEEDNIYTYYDSSADIQQGVPPLDCAVDQDPEYCKLHPSVPKDSFLVNECGLGAAGEPPVEKGPSCFPADTRVWINGALVQISRVAAGQNVGKPDGASVALCAEKPASLKQIERVQEHEGTFECYDIVLESGNRISVASSHLFLVNSGQWIRVQNLRSGSKLQSLKGPISIKNVVKRAMPFVGKVYNLKVKGGERYFVGKDGVIVRDW